MLGALGDDLLGDQGRDLVQGNVLALSRGTVLELHGATLDAALATDDLVGEAHEVGIVELDAGTLLAVVQDDLDASVAQVLGQLLGSGPDEVILGVQGDDLDLVGGD